MANVHHDGDQIFFTTAVRSFSFHRHYVLHITLLKGYSIALPLNLYKTPVRLEFIL